MQGIATIKGGNKLSLLERSNKMIENNQKEAAKREDELNKNYIENLSQRIENYEPKNKKHFCVEDIMEENLPVGNYQIGVKL